MKVFWSWQSDTPGKTGRHFVRDVLTDAIKALKEAADIEEPTERASQEALHLDSDRQGVPGSPDLAPTIFAKISASTVFIADVTLVGGVDQQEGAASRAKKLINSNVAIEYGYALHALTDKSILMVQNTYYGPRDELPFDLKHKAGPIQYCLALDATKDEIEKERANLRGSLVAALRPYLRRTATVIAETVFEETATTRDISTFWQPADVLAVLGSVLSRVRGPREDDDEPIQYRFHEPHTFYLRLIPTRQLPEPLAVTALTEIVERRALKVLTRTINGGMPSRNKFGAITYQPDGKATTPMAFSQLFRNGEIWGVTREPFVPFNGELVVPMENVRNFYNFVLSNYVNVATADLKIPYPYQIELGAVGLDGVRLSLPPSLRGWNQISDCIYERQLKVRRTVNYAFDGMAIPLVDEFILRLYDLAGVALPSSVAS